LTYLPSVDFGLAPGPPRGTLSLKGLRVPTRGPILMFPSPYEPRIPPRGISFDVSRGSALPRTTFSRNTPYTLHPSSPRCRVKIFANLFTAASRNIHPYLSILSPRHRYLPVIDRLLKLPLGFLRLLPLDHPNSTSLSPLAKSAGSPPFLCVSCTPLFPLLPVSPVPPSSVGPSFPFLSVQCPITGQPIVPCPMCMYKSSFFGVLPFLFTSAVAHAIPFMKRLPRGFPASFPFVSELARLLLHFFFFRRERFVSQKIPLQKLSLLLMVRFLHGLLWGRCFFQADPPALDWRASLFLAWILNNVAVLFRGLLLPPQND